jgi:outer membrane protein TolC
MKKRVSLVLLLVLVSVFVSAASGDTNQGYSIEEAIRTACENNKQLKIDDLEIKAKERSIKKSWDNINALTAARDEAGVLNNLIVREVKPGEAKTDLEIAKMKKQDNIRQIGLDVYKTIAGILLTEKELESEKLKLELQYERYNMIKARDSAGFAIQNDILDAEYKLQEKKHYISTLEEKLMSGNMEFKKLLNIPFDNEPIIIKDKLALLPFRRYGIDKVIEEVLEKNTLVFEKEEDLKNKEKIMDLTKRVFMEDAADYHINILNLETARIDFEETRRNIEISIRNKYNDLLSSKDKIDIANNYIKLCEKKLELAQVKYDSGAISKEEYLTEKEKYLDAEYQKFAAIHDYNIAKAEFENLIGE